MVSPLDKGTSKKNDISNFQPVDILTTFLKIYEKVTTKLSYITKKKYSSPFISAYRQNYSARHVSISLLEKKSRYKNFIVRIVFQMSQFKIIDFFCDFMLLFSKYYNFLYQEILILCHNLWYFLALYAIYMIKLREVEGSLTSPIHNYIIPSFLLVYCHTCETCKTLTTTCT